MARSIAASQHAVKWNRCPTTVANRIPAPRIGSHSQDNARSPSRSDNPDPAVADAAAARDDAGSSSSSTVIAFSLDWRMTGRTKRRHFRGSFQTAPAIATAVRRLHDVTLFIRVAAVATTTTIQQYHRHRRHDTIIHETSSVRQKKKPADSVFGLSARVIVRAPKVWWWVKNIPELYTSMYTQCHKDAEGDYVAAV